MPDDEYTRKKDANPMWQYLWGIPLMLVMCAASGVVNAAVLWSAHWVRRPLSPTLCISLSLAAADVFASGVLSAGLLCNSYLPHVWGRKLPPLCAAMVLELIRLGGLVTTVWHLVALAVNHLLGITRPLQYLRIMTRRATAALLGALWFAPPICFAAHFMVAAPADCQPQFLNTTRFRAALSTLIIAPLAIMSLIYTIILVLLRRHQATWQRPTAGSRRHKGGTSHNFHGSNTTGRKGDESTARKGQKRRHRQKHISRNIRAVHTTLLILGSYALGYFLATAVYLLLCETCKITKRLDCTTFVTLHWAGNLCIVLKTLINPIIYAARMHEIQDALRRMTISIMNSLGIDNQGMRTSNTNNLTSGTATSSGHRLSLYSNHRSHSARTDYNSTLL